METTTIRIPSAQRDILKVIGSLERRDVMSIVSELVDEYIERHRETLDLLSRPDWVDSIRAGKKEVATKAKGKTLHELGD